MRRGHVASRKMDSEAIRFWNDEVLKNIDGVLTSIEDALREDAAEEPESQS